MKTKMKVAGGSYNRSVSRNHYTTIGFGELFPVYAEQVLPNDNVTIRPELFGRSQPSIVPTLTRLSVMQRCFFVSYSSIWKYWNDFINGLPSQIRSGSGVTTSVYIKRVPVFTSENLRDVFISTAGDEGGLTVFVSHDDVSNGEPFDICIQNSQNPPLWTYYKLTVNGKRFLKVLQSLGYNFSFRSSYPGTQNQVFSALDLFCYYKVLFDRYLPSTLRVNSVLDQVFSGFNELNVNSAGQIFVPVNMISRLATLPQLYYDNNYFTSQWTNLQEPVPNYIAPSIDRISEGVINQKGTGTEDIKASADQTALINSSTTPTTASRNIMMASMRKYIMRLGLVGTRAIDRFFSIFGVHVPELELQMSKYVGSINSPIQMMDVVAQGDTDSLGDLGGKSWVAQSDGTFKVNCDQHGLVLVLASIDTPSQFVSGVRRRVLHLYPHDYYSPDFDDTTLQATSGDELIGQLTYDVGNLSSELSRVNLVSGKTFGFTARYDEYRKPIDDITGDFTIPTLNTTIDGYVNPRKLIDNLFLQSEVETSAVSDPDNPSLDVKNVATGDILFNEQITANPVTVQSQSDAMQFNRIYKDLDGRGDPLRCHFKFGVNINGVVKPSDISQFIDGNGSSIEVEKNGNKFD